MVAIKKAGLYSPISLEAINVIGKLAKKNPRLLLAYIVLARFAGQLPVGGFGPNRVTGAGANAVSKILKIRWSRANELVKALIQLEIITAAPKGLFVGKSPATYVMCFVGDIQIPHALVDGMVDVAGISRLFDEQYAQSPEVIATAMVALVHCYRQHDMQRWGGVNQDALYQDWLIRSVEPEGKGFKIKAIRGANTNRSVSRSFFSDVMHSLGVRGLEQKTGQAVVQAAFQLLCDSGLLYEAVTIFDDQHNPIFPLRINDVYAARTDSEPSFIEAIQGAGYYTREDNPKGDAEGVWFILPIDPTQRQCSLVGVTRLRFRCASAATAMGLARDANNIRQIKADLIQCDLIDDYECVE